MKNIFGGLSLLIYSTAFCQIPIKYIQANVYLFHKDTAKAIELFYDTLKQNPNQPYVFKNLAVLLSSKKQYKESNEFYQKLFEKSDSTVLFPIIQNYAQLRDIPNSLKWLKIYLSYTHKLPENVIRSDAQLIFLHKEKEWNELWKTNWFSDLEVKLGDIYYLYENKEVNSLIETIEEALKNYQGNNELLMWRAKAFLLGENTKEALKSIDQIIKTQPDNIEALIFKAHIFEKDHKQKNLATLYLQIYKAEPWDIRWLYKSGVSFNKSEQFKNAIKQLETYISFDSTFANAYLECGNAYFNLGNKSKASDLYSIALNFNKGLDEAFYGRAVCHYEANDFEKAFYDLCMALDLNPRNGKYYYQRGLVNFAMKKEMGACRDFEQAKKLEYIQAESYIQRYCNGK